MGARVARMFQNFNLENRVLREISKEKPTAAPRHAGPEGDPRAGRSEVADSVNRKNEPLLAHLRSVYVESTDPGSAATEASKQPAVRNKAERRPLRVSFPGSMTELTDVPKGKLTIAEAVKALGSYQHQPQTWTPENIAQEYSLDLKDAKAILDFFIPFKVELIPPKNRSAKQIKAS
ncbi:NADH dehydrogenase [ubiquinone] 1 alpha subcomplex assembly factor 4 [Melanotaenia boesemani]|uniref:NADH dehydrogenase [ubiquinone] 1 alpha subcomplex assembly factor 4 n=1 Tax=Melanotaenia boesemani TaxID=1250792 RepID=UPI001C04DF67|nr:NADH dehydrogenase [ubiquinone] 1 alpha subcomplex assembly factor 4 [Melanotaenia boesemani]